MSKMFSEEKYILAQFLLKKGDGVTITYYDIEDLVKRTTWNNRHRPFFLEEGIIEPTGKKRKRFFKINTKPLYQLFLNEFILFLAQKVPKYSFLRTYRNIAKNEERFNVEMYSNQLLTSKSVSRTVSDKDLTVREPFFSRFSKPHLSTKDDGFDQQEMASIRTQGKLQLILYEFFSRNVTKKEMVEEIRNMEPSLFLDFKLAIQKNNSDSVEELFAKIISQWSNEFIELVREHEKTKFSLQFEDLYDDPLHRLKMICYVLESKNQWRNNDRTK